MSEQLSCRGPVGPLAMVTGRYPGASQTFIDREVRALRAAGCQVFTVTIRSPEHGIMAGTFQIAEAARVHRILASARNPITLCRAFAAAARRPGRLLSTLRLAIAARPEGSLTALARHAAYFVEAVLLADFLGRREIAHVHNHLGDGSGTVTMLAAELAGIPFSMTLHGPEVFAAPGLWRLDIKISRARVTICISEDGRAKAVRLCDAAHHHKVVVVPCGVTPEIYEGAPSARGARKLVFVGRLVPRKGVAVLIDALARVRALGHDVELDIVGEGPERQRLEATVAQRGFGEIVRFHGVLDEAGVAEVLRQSDLLVVPSHSEGLPVVIMEAMASGLPVVASAVDGIPELVQHGLTGLLVPPDDARQLADAIGTLLNQPAMARRMATAGCRLVVARHDANRNAIILLRTVFPDAVHLLG